MRFQPLVPASELSEGYRKAFRVADCELLLLVHQGQPHIVEALCPHMGSRLDAGELRDGCIQCPHHLFRFALDSGECRTQGALCDPLRTLPTAELDDWIGVDLNLLADWL